MADRLNDDCWYHIFSLLSLRDQIGSIRTCTRFQHIITTLLQRKFRQLELNLAYVQLTDTEFNILLKSVCSTVQVLRLKFLTPAKVRILLLHDYSSVKDLRFSLAKASSSMSDDDIAVLSRKCPQLETFSPHGSFNGRNFKDFAHLQHLTLSYCNNICPQYMQEMLEHLPLRSLKLSIDIVGMTDIVPCLIKTLQRITLSTSELSHLMFGSKIQNFPMLKTIVVTDSCTQHVVEFIHSLPVCNRDKIASFEITRRVGLLALLQLPYVFPQLRKLTITAVAFDHDLLRVLSNCQTKLPSMRELIFWDCLVSTEGITSLLQYWTSLDSLQFFNCQLDVRSDRYSSKLGSILVLNVAEVMRRRTKRMVFNWYPSTPVHFIGSDELFATYCMVAGEEVTYEPVTIEFM